MCEDMGCVMRDPIERRLVLMGAGGWMGSWRIIYDMMFINRRYCGTFLFVCVFCSILRLLSYLQLFCFDYLARILPCL